MKFIFKILNWKFTQILYIVIVLPVFWNMNKLQFIQSFYNFQFFIVRYRACISFQADNSLRYGIAWLQGEKWKC